MRSSRTIPVFLLPDASRQGPAGTMCWLSVVSGLCIVKFTDSMGSIVPEAHLCLLALQIIDP